MKRLLVILSLAVVAGAVLWRKSGSAASAPHESRRKVSLSDAPAPRAADSPSPRQPLVPPSAPAPSAPRPDSSDAERTFREALARKDCAQIIHLLMGIGAVPPEWMLPRMGELFELLSKADGSIRPFLVQLLDRTTAPILQDFVLAAFVSKPGPDVEQYFTQRLGTEQNPMKLSKYLLFMQANHLESPEVERQVTNLVHAPQQPLQVRMAAADTLADLKNPGIDTTLKTEIAREQNPEMRSYLEQLLVSRHPPMEGFLIKKCGSGEFQSGDILLTQNGRPVTSQSQMAKLVYGAARTGNSNPVVYAVYRNGQTVEIRTTPQDLQPMLGGIAGEYVVPESKR